MWVGIFPLIVFFLPPLLTHSLGRCTFSVCAALMRTDVFCAQLWQALIFANDNRQTESVGAAPAQLRWVHRSSNDTEHSEACFADPQLPAAIWSTSSSHFDPSQTLEWLSWYIDSVESAVSSIIVFAQVFPAPCTCDMPVCGHELEFSCEFTVLVYRYVFHPRAMTWIKILFSLWRVCVNIYSAKKAVFTKSDVVNISWGASIHVPVTAKLWDMYRTYVRKQAYRERIFFVSIETRYRLMSLFFALKCDFCVISTTKSDARSILKKIATRWRGRRIAHDADLKTKSTCSVIIISISR